MMNRRTEYQDCTKCAAYNVNLEMDIDHDKDENTDQCGLFFGVEILHPCA